MRNSIRNIGRGRALTTVIVAMAAALGIASPAYSIQPVETSSVRGVIQICEDNEVSVFDEDGNRYDQDELDALIKTVEDICDPPAEEPNEGISTYTYYNVVAVASYNRSTGVMGVSAYANGLPRASYKLSCIYRSEPVSGSLKPWSSCGAAVATATYLTTRGNYWCPAPGTRWHVHAALYNGRDKLLNEDDAWVIAT